MKLGTIWTELGLRTDKFDQGLRKAEAAIERAEKSVEGFSNVFRPLGDIGERLATEVASPLQVLGTTVAQVRADFEVVTSASSDAVQSMLALSQAGGSAQAAISGMAGATELLSGAQVALSLSSEGVARHLENMACVSDVLRDRSISAMQALLGCSGAVANYEGELRSAAGFTGGVAGEQLELFRAQMMAADREVTDLSSAVRDKLTPSLVELEKTVRSGTGWLSQLAPAMERVARSQAVAATAVGLAISWTTIAPIIIALLQLILQLFPDLPGQIGEWFSKQAREMARRTPAWSYPREPVPGVIAGSYREVATELEVEMPSLKRHIAEVGSRWAPGEYAELWEECQGEIRQWQIAEAARLHDSLVNALRERYRREQQIRDDAFNRELQAVQKQVNEKIKEYDRDYRERLKRLDQDTREAIKGIEAQIQAIDRQTEAEEDAEQERRELAHIEDLRRQLAQEEDVEKRLAIQDELNEALEDRERRLLLASREALKEALRQQIEDLREQAEQKRELWQEEWEAKREKEQQFLEATTERINAERDQLRQHYDDLLNEYSLSMEAQQLILEGNLDEIVELLGQYEPAWFEMGKAFGERLVGGILGPVQDLYKVLVAEVLRGLGIEVQWGTKTRAKGGRYTDWTLLAAESYLDQSEAINELNRQIMGLKKAWWDLTEAGRSEEAERAHQLAQEIRQQIVALGGTFIPAYQRGGIVMQPHLAMVGEVPELILPLSQLSQLRSTRIEVYATVTGNYIASDYDIDRIGEKLVRAIRRAGVMMR